jgi:perosamine synthetase
MSKLIAPVPTQFEPGAPADEGGIALCVPELRGNERAYLQECLDTNFVSSVGPFVNRFERELAAYVGAPHAVATVNGTAALHIALLTVGVEPDDEVLVPSLTFIAPVNAIRYANAWPVLIDAEPGYWQMDPERVAHFLDSQCRWAGGQLRNTRTGRRVRAIMPVHILGHPVDMDPIVAAARKYDLAVIEDATESLGARYRGRPVGRLGDIACFSFNGNKLITTGAGGMIVTDNEAWAARAKYLTTQAKDDGLEFVHGEVGYNYRLTNIQAALGVAQLELIDEFIAIKRRNAAAYAEAFRGVPGITPMPQAPWAESVFWLYTILIDEAAFGRGSRALLTALATAGIQARPLWQPAHLSPAHRNAVMTPCPVAESLNARAVSLPSSVGLTAEEQRRVVAAVVGQRGERI